MQTTIRVNTFTVTLELPAGTDLLAMATPLPLPEPRLAIQEAFANSIGCPNLDGIIEDKLAARADANAVVVISDNTRPVPYKGDAGILWPILEKLMAHGILPERLLILVATGTHRPLTERELREMLDPRVFAAGIRIVNHDCHERNALVHLGRTSRGTEVYINRRYLEADLKILTGLVESHFMAGASGGRKSVCPGLVGEESTYIFHGAAMLASPYARDLVLAGNPCHEEALEVARMAGVDYIVNVTLDQEFNLTGVFAGELEQAHARAVARLKEYVAIPIEHAYDIVLTHAGHVGVNHYQAAKAAVVSLPALKEGGYLIMIADHTDPDPVGSRDYRMLLSLLKRIGGQHFLRLLFSPDWTFIPDQWQVQMWAKFFTKIPPEHFIHYAPQLSPADWDAIPGLDGNTLLPPEGRYLGSQEVGRMVIETALRDTIRRLASTGRTEVKVAYLADGPYGIPVMQC